MIAIPAITSTAKGTVIELPRPAIQGSASQVENPAQQRASPTTSASLRWRPTWSFRRSTGVRSSSLSASSTGVGIDALDAGLDGRAAGVRETTEEARGGLPMQRVVEAGTVEP